MSTGIEYYNVIASTNYLLWVRQWSKSWRETTIPGKFLISVNVLKYITPKQTYLESYAPTIEGNIVFTSEAVGNRQNPETNIRGNVEYAHLFPYVDGSKGAVREYVRSKTEQEIVDQKSLHFYLIYSSDSENSYLKDSFEEVLGRVSKFVENNQQFAILCDAKAIRTQRDRLFEAAIPNRFFSTHPQIPLTHLSVNDTMPPFFNESKLYCTKYMYGTKNTIVTQATTRLKEDGSIQTSFNYQVDQSRFTELRNEFVLEEYPIGYPLNEMEEG